MFTLWLYLQNIKTNLYIHFKVLYFQFVLVLIVTQLNAQEYESDHEELSSYDEGGEYHGHPDYSKYYSVDTSAPLAASTNGFVGELSGFNQPNGE